MDREGSFVADAPGLYRITAVVGAVSAIAEVSAVPRPPRREVKLKAHGVVPPEAYAKSVAAMIELAQGAGIRVGLCTPTLFEDPGSTGWAEELNARLESYSSWLASAASEMINVN